MALRSDDRALSRDEYALPREGADRSARRPAPALVTEPSTVRVVELVECTIFGGPPAALREYRCEQYDGEPLAVLIHSKNSSSEPHASLGSSSAVLTRYPGADESLPLDVPVVGLAAPWAHVKGARLAPVVHLRATPLLRASRSLLLSLLRDLRLPGSESGYGIDAVLVSLVRSLLDENPHSVTHETSEHSLAGRLTTLIEARHTDPRLDVTTIAQTLHTSRRHLYRHVQDGAGVATVLTRRRVTTARRLLETREDLTLAEIAIRSGFTSASRMRVQFQKYTGQTPTEFRAARGRH